MPKCSSSNTNTQILDVDVFARTERNSSVDCTITQNFDSKHAVTIKNREFKHITVQVKVISVNDRIIFQSSNDSSWDKTFNVRRRKLGERFKEGEASDMLRTKPGEQGNEESIEADASYRFQQSLMQWRDSKNVTIDVDCV